MELRGHACFYFRFIPTLASLNEKHKGTQKQSTRGKKETYSENVVCVINKLRLFCIFHTNFIIKTLSYQSGSSTLPTSHRKACSVSCSVAFGFCCQSEEIKGRALQAKLLLVRQQ